MGSFPVNEPPAKKKRGKQKKLPVIRHSWTDAEKAELRQYFREFFQKKKCPRDKDCKRAMTLSKRNDGDIWRMKWENIKKKVNNMMKGN